MKVFNLKMLAKGFLGGSITGLAVGIGITLVMPDKEHYTSFTFEQNVALSDNIQPSTKFQLGNQTFTAYAIDDAKLARTLAVKEAMIASLKEIDAKAIAKTQFDNPGKVVKVE
jgi:hypothetical protein